MNKYPINNFLKQLKQIPFKSYFIICLFLYYISSFYYLVGPFRGIIITVILIVFILIIFFSVILLITFGMQEREKAKAKKMGMTYEEYQLEEINAVFSDDKSNQE